ncbi:MAG: DUF2851 family protein [Planctomycetes bacterium]|nr:DUF2851 family protein [Planctomycetota bacterium]
MLQPENIPPYRFMERYREAVERATGVVEEKGHYRGVPVRERVVRCIWYGQHLALGSLHTLDGESVRIVTPGWWNPEGGPDFLKAELAFGDEPVQRGDVEIHLGASDWYRHEHHRDPRYNRVLLHVILWNDRESDFVVNEQGQPVRQLVVEDNLDRDLGELLDTLSQEHFPIPSAPTAGLCHRYLRENRVDGAWVASFLEAAGDERILRKARALARRARQAGEDQAFYEAWMASLGYKRNQDAFETLARNAPLRALAPAAALGPIALQACFFRLSGLWPQEGWLPGLADAETEKLLQAYSEVLAGLPALTGLVHMQPSDWDLSGTRPVNFPARRLAAASHWLAGRLDHGLVASLEKAIPDDPRLSRQPLSREESRRITQALESELSPGRDPYWSLRCAFGDRRATRPSRLIGRDRIGVMLVNVALPALLARALQRPDPGLESLLHQVYHQWQPLPPTNVTRFMAARVFGDEARASAVVTSACRQQGLYQLYSDFERDDRNCESCAFAKAMLKAED